MACAIEVDISFLEWNFQGYNAVFLVIVKNFGIARNLKVTVFKLLSFYHCITDFADRISVPFRANVIFHNRESDRAESTRTLALEPFREHIIQHGSVYFYAVVFDFIDYV